MIACIQRTHACIKLRISGFCTEFNLYLIKYIWTRKCTTSPYFLRVWTLQWLLFWIRWIDQQRLTERTSNAIRFWCFAIFQSIVRIRQSVRFAGTLLHQSIVSDAVRSHQLCFNAVQSTFRYDIHTGHMKWMTVSAAPSLIVIHIQMPIAMIMMIIYFGII